MAKFYGEIGFGETVKIRPGVTTVKNTKRNYYGDITRNSRMLQNSGQVNDDINVSNTISVIADPFAYQNFHLIRYVKFMGAKWKVTNVEVQYPRLLLTIGGVYNDNDGETS